jgi:hypothetical protein
MGQVWEQLRPVAADLGEESLLAAAFEQVADHHDREHFSVGARSSGSWSWGYLERAMVDGLVDEDIDVDEQLFGWQHEAASSRGSVLDNRVLPQRPFASRSPTPHQPT